MKLLQGNNIRYVGENLYSVRIPTDGVLVIEVNAQGIFDLSNHQREFIYAFPKTYKAFMQMCREGKVKGGEAHKFIEDNYILYLIVTAERLVGDNKDTAGEIETFTACAIWDMLADVEPDDVIYSGLINRATNGIAFAAKEIASAMAIYKTKQWTMCTK